MRERTTSHAAAYSCGWGIETGEGGKLEREGKKWQLAVKGKFSSKNDLDMKRRVETRKKERKNERKKERKKSRKEKKK